MNKLCLSLLMLASTPALLAMQGTTGHTLKEVVAQDTIRLADHIIETTTRRTGKKMLALDLRGIGLTSIDGITELLKNDPRLGAIEKVDLSRNNLTEVPVELITLFPTIRFLNLSRNNLTTLPDEIGTLPLTFLSLSNNAISTLPQGFAQLKTLVNLNLGHNCLETFQEEIFGELTSLKMLKLNARVTNEKRVIATPEKPLSETDKAKVNALFKAKFDAIPGSQLKV